MDANAGAGIVFAADAATAACAAFNAAWFAARRFGDGSEARRTASGVMALLNCGIAVQAVAAQALYSARRFGFDTAALFEPEAWLLARLPLLAGTLLLSLLILRRSARG